MLKRGGCSVPSQRVAGNRKSRIFRELKISHIPGESRCGFRRPTPEAPEGRPASGRGSGATGARRRPLCCESASRHLPGP